MITTTIILKPLARSEELIVEFDALPRDTFTLSIFDMIGAWTVQLVRDGTEAPISTLFAYTVVNCILDGGHYALHLTPIPGFGGSSTFSVITERYSEQV